MELLRSSESVLPSLVTTRVRVLVFTVTVVVGLWRHVYFKAAVELGRE